MDEAGGRTEASSSEAVDELFSEAVWQRIAQCLSLCRRELEIVRCVFKDMKETAIGRALGISPHTVNSYLQRLYRKLNVSSRPQLLVRVFREYLRLGL